VIEVHLHALFGHRTVVHAATLVGVGNRTADGDQGNRNEGG